MAFDYTPIFLSLRVACLSVLLIVLVSIPVAGLMSKRNFPGDFLESLITLPLVLPPSVVGFILLVLFVKTGPIGSLLQAWFHVSIVFTWWAAVIASSVVAFPLMYQALKSAIESVDPNLQNAARTLGAGELRIFLTITLPLAWPGIVSGIIMAFARSLGEFGATLMVAGNIPGKTQTMSLAIYLANQEGDNKTAAILVGIMTLFSFIVVYSLNRWTKRRRRLQEGGLP